MRVRVKLFGPAAAAVDADEAVVDAAGDDGVTCAEVVALLGAEHPALEPHLRSGRLAVNHAFAAPGNPIREGDEVALISMVSGG